MSQRQQRRLVVVRHASAESFASSDHERTLTSRGHDQARELGRWLAEQGLLPDFALVSSASRAVETWQGIAAGGGLELEPTVDGGVYGGDSYAVLEMVRTLPTESRTALVLGHNPTVASLTLDLADGEGDADLLMEVTGGFPPCSAAVLTVPTAWSELSAAGATLTGFRPGS